MGHPDLDLGNIETALDALTDRCYYFTVERKNYKFSLRENLSKRISEKRANIAATLIDETVRGEIQLRFAPKEGVECAFFPAKSIQISDRPYSPAPSGRPDAPGTTQPTLPIGDTCTPTPASAPGLFWTGEIPAQSWMNFCTKVLSQFASARSLKLTVTVEVPPEGGVSKQKPD